VPWTCSRDWPRAVTASMLRRSLPFQPTLLAISSSNASARALPTSPPARHAGRQPSPADLVSQAVQLRRLPQASPQVCKGVAYCSKASACERTRLGMQRMNALTLCVWPDHACLSLWTRGLLSAQAGCDATHTWQSRSRLRIVSFASHACVACVHCLSLAPSHTLLPHTTNQIIRTSDNVRHPKPETLHPKHQPLHLTRKPKA
jgi:hypothetical protein